MQYHVQTVHFGTLDGERLVKSVILLTERDEDYWFNHNEFEILRATGLKDSYGKEIYEGDILEIDYSAGHERDSSYDVHGNFKVIFRNGEWQATGKNIWSDEHETSSVWGFINDYGKSRGYVAKLIGNVYENPSLI